MMTKQRFYQFGSLILLLVFNTSIDAARTPLAVFGNHAFFYENKIRDMLTQDIDTTLFFQSGEHESGQKMIRFWEGYLLEDSQALELESGKHLLTILYRSPAQARYARFDAFIISSNKPYLTEIQIPEIEQPIYQGSMTLGISGHASFLKIYKGIVDPFFNPPFVYDIFSFGLWDETLSLVSKTFSKPQNYHGYFNLARHCLENGQYHKAVTFSLMGLEGLKEDPELMEDQIRSQVRLTLGKSYVGVKDLERAKLVLRSIVADLPNTREAPEAKRMLDSLK